MRLVQLAHHLDVVTRHDLLLVRVLRALWPVERAGLISCANEHLGPVVLAEARVAAALLLAEHVHGDEELAVRFYFSGDRDDHAAAHVFALDAAEEQTGVVACARLVAGFLESLNVGDFALDAGGALADELDFAVLLEDAALDTTRDDGAAAGDGEDVLDGHEEGLLGVTRGGRYPAVDLLEQLVDLLLADFRLAALERAQRGAHDNGRLVALEAVAGEQLAHLHLDELQHFLVLDGVDLVDEDDDLLDADLAGEQQVLAGLWHLAVRGGDDDDGAVHVGGARDHVLDVIGVARAVDVCVVAGVGLVLDVGGRDGDATLALFGGLVNGAICEELCEALLGLSLGDGGCEGGLVVLVSCGRVREARRRGTFPWST
jgi:hypothetical protein